VVLDRTAPFAPQFEGARVVVDQGGHGTREMIDAGAEAGVELWQAVTTGVDHTDVAYLLEKGIRVTNTPGTFSAVALAEHVLFLMLFIAKNFRETEANLRAGILYRPLNDELEGTTLGLVGLGASGRELARRAAVLGMRVIAIDALPVPADELGSLGAERCDEPEHLDRLLAESDYVSIHIPLNAETRHLIGVEKLALMKPSAVLINVARGGIVDEAALAAALTSGRLRAAGIDVFSQEPPDADDPLLQLPQVVATPHVAGTTYGTSRRRGEVCVENITRIANGLPPLYEILSA
jgi:phosphoglycerate dehydrogenase-like enzyme